MREHGSILIYVHGNHKAREDGNSRTATSTLTQLLNSDIWRRVKRDIIYLSLRRHRQNDSCIKMGSGNSHFYVLLIVRDKVTRQRPQTTISEEK